MIMNTSGVVGLSTCQLQKIRTGRKSEKKIGRNEAVVYENKLGRTHELLYAESENG